MIDILRDADFRVAAEFFHCLFRVSDQRAGTVEERAQGFREFRCVSFDLQGFAVGDDVDAWRAMGFREADLAFEAAFQVDKGGFDMLAGAESGGAEIRAGAGKRALLQVADLNLIGHPAG
jgi:hypothetical protein